MEYFWGVIIKAYKEFEERVIYIKDLLVRKALKQSKSNFLLEKNRALWPISDIEKDCPGISKDWIRYVLRELKAKARIKIYWNRP